MFIFSAHPQLFIHTHTVVELQTLKAASYIWKWKMWMVN